MIITIASHDTFYLKQLLVFLTSLRVYNPEVALTVYLDGYTKGEIGQLRSKYPGFVFESRSIEKVDDRGIHYILLRIDLILEHLKAGRNAAWVDIDVIVRGSVAPFLDIEDKQFKILFRGEDVKEKVRFNAGILNIGSSPETIAFVERWRERLVDNMEWGMGQLELYRAYQEHKDNIELIKMSKSFNDLGCSIKNDDEFFKENSVMWHCKKSHFNHPRFQKEFNYYLKLIGAD